MRRALWLAISAWLIVGFAPSVGEEGTDRCVYDRNAAGWAEEREARLRGIYDVLPIKAHQARGDQMRRAFFVDGNGHDVVAIVFVRTPGREPTAWIHFPRRQGKAASEPLQAEVPKAVWQHVLNRSWLFDRKLVALPTVHDDGSITLCLHPWNYTVEALDLPEPDASARADPARRRTGNSCEDDLIQDYANELGRTALPLFPACAALDPAGYRNDALRLEDCAKLRGDRLAAAEVLNIASGFREPGDPEDSPALARLFADGAVVHWEGTVLRGPALEKAWLAKLKSSRAYYFRAQSVEGLSSEKVRLIGNLV